MIGIISDTHGLLRKEVIEKLRGCDLILHAGDIGSESLLKELRATAPIKAVRGNCDRESWCKELPENELLEVQGQYIYLIHNIREFKLEPKAAGINIIISGHSHLPNAQWENGVFYLNPGSCGPKRFNLPTSMALLNIEGEKIEANHFYFETSRT